MDFIQHTIKERLYTQIGASDGFVRGQFPHRALITDTAFLYDIGAVANQGGEMQVLFG